MESFQSIVKDIEKIKIQGAENVAKAAAKGIKIIVDSYGNKGKKELWYHLLQAREIIVKIRPTEPALRNVVNYLFFKLNQENAKEELIKRHAEVSRHFEHNNELAAKIGARKVSNGDVVFTHCHSSSVTRILKKAKTEGKKFNVYNTETRPLFQGRITAMELARAGIPVTHFVDSAARIALKEADIMFIGADAITSEGNVYNKIGSEMFAEIAYKYDVPVYVCTDSWKFDPKSVFGFEEKVETRSSKEVWPTAPHGVKIDNRAFEKVDSSLISGIISELGVYKPEVFVEEVKRAYPWMFH